MVRDMHENGAVWLYHRHPAAVRAPVSGNDNRVKYRRAG